jgi:3',5'-cyclic AMP phosphodiesterase CpdA
VDLPGNELYYSFVGGNSLFVVLDSYIKGEDKRITGEQFKWLEQVLAASKQKHTFVFVHHPLYPEKGKGKHHGNSLDRYKEDRDRLQALFVKHQVTAVFAGHEHLYLRKTVGGIPHIIAGGGGAPLYAKDEDGGFHHYVYVTVDGDKVSGEVWDMNGKIRDRF